MDLLSWQAAVAAYPLKTELSVAEIHSRMGLPAWGQATADDARRQPAVKANRLERFHRSGKRSAADRFAKIPSGDNDTSAQPQTQAMGAARREPRRGEIPMERYSQPSFQTTAHSPEKQQRIRADT